MERKASQVRNYILRQLEERTLSGGDKLDGARETARKTGVCFTKVQEAFDFLTKDGILEAHPRKGTFVQKNWHEQILHCNLKVYSVTAPWREYLKGRLATELPDLRISSGFTKAVFEIKTSWDLEAEQDEFMDLREIFESLHPDASIFYAHPFKSFYFGNRLIGIPLVFSPRVMFYNSKLLKKYGCPIPCYGWKWNDMIDSIRILRKKLPSQNIMNWMPKPFFFMNFIFRAGGGLVAADEGNTVLIDHPDTIRGLEFFRELGEELGYGNNEIFESNKFFAEGESAFHISSRQIIPMLERHGLKERGVIHLPHIPGGADITAQATDLLCIRKTCSDTDTAAKLVALLLSEEVQNYVGSLKYGIPVRKTAALKSIDAENPEDSLFLVEAPKSSAEYKVDSREIARLISGGIRMALMNSQDIRKSMQEIASAVRTILKIRKAIQ